MDSIRETAYDWTSRDDAAFLSSNDPKVINEIEEYASEYPDEVSIQQQPHNNGGYLMARIPKSWIRIKPPKKKNLTDEQREVLRKRLEKARITKGR